MPRSVYILGLWSSEDACVDQLTCHLILLTACFCCVLAAAWHDRNGKRLIFVSSAKFSIIIALQVGSAFT